MFRDSYPVAWQYHRNSSRWPFNMLPADSEHSFVSTFKEYCNSNAILLPKTDLPSNQIGDLLQSRYSCRDYKKKTLELEKISSVLKGAYGITNKSFINDFEFYERPVPSGGSLYSLELYLFSLNIKGVEQGIYHYSSITHSLEEVEKMDLDDIFISNLFMHQPYLSNCAGIIVMTSMIERNMWKYADRGYRYILFEAGHCAQNINLLSLALNLGTLNLGGFFDSTLSDLLKLDEDEEVPLYCIALGYPENESKAMNRMPLGI